MRARFWFWTLPYMPERWAPYVLGLALKRMPRRVG